VESTNADSRDRTLVGIVHHRIACQPRYDLFLLADEGNVLDKEPTSLDVHEREDMIMSVEQRPLAGLEAVGFGDVLGGTAPTLADGAEVHVAVDVVVCQEAIAYLDDEVVRQGGPALDWSRPLSRASAPFGDGESARHGGLCALRASRFDVFQCVEFRWGVLDYI